MRTKTIFISGKVSGISPIQAYTKFRTAEFRLNNEIEKYRVINPISLCKSTYPWWLCMVICLYNLLFKADYIYMLDNWQDSRGAKIEHKVARLTGKEVLYE
jgi:hypothetical protein